MTANVIGWWQEVQGQRYWVECDRERNLLHAEISIKAHDKAATMRKVVNKATLERLQKAIRPVEPCPVCGAEK